MPIAVYFRSPNHTFTFVERQGLEIREIGRVQAGQAPQMVELPDLGAPRGNNPPTIQYRPPVEAGIASFNWANGDFEHDQTYTIDLEFENFVVVQRFVFRRDNEPNVVYTRQQQQQQQQQ